MQATQHNATYDADTEQTAEELLAGVSPDLNIKLLSEVVLNAYDPHVISYTSFSAPSSRGAELQSRATDYLRGRLHSMGWECSEVGGVSCVVSQHDGVRIACSTDGGSAIGLDYPSEPKLRKKGSGTIQVAGHIKDVPLPFPEFEQLNQDDMQEIDDLDFYYLLMHIDRSRLEIRMELSSPLFDQKGENIGWQRRILLPALSTSNGSIVNIDPLPIPEIQVVRRMS